MKMVTLGKTGITTPQNAFGALPVQRVDMDAAVKLLRRAFEGGMVFFDTARAYSDSEEKLGNAFKDVRTKLFIATKTMSATPDGFWRDLETSLKKLQTDYIDIYQFHGPKQCFHPDDGTGMYECMLEAKRQGMIRHIGITNHSLAVAHQAIESGLYETLQFPFSYLATEKELELVNGCRENNMGFIAMKGLAGGLITRSEAAFAYMAQYDNVLPIWGVQREHELDEWLSYMHESPTMTPEIQTFIQREKQELSGDFCRGCGYCMPCPQGIVINQCARMSLMLRRAPSANSLTPEAQAQMMAIENCVECGQCKSRCPYGLDTPALLRRNLEDYRRVLAGEVKVN